MPFRLEPSRDRKLFRLVKSADNLRLDKGDPVYGSGDEAREVFLVQSGFVRLVLPGMEQGSRSRTVGIALPWEVFGDEALTEGRRRYGATAGSKCAVRPLHAGKFLQGLKTARKSLNTYLEGVERELHRLRHAQGGSRGPSSGQRLAEVVLDLAERCGEPVGRGIRLSERLTHQVLADLAGSHRATVTTLLNDWLYQDVLATDSQGRLVLSKPREFWSLAGYHPPSSPVAG